jgi:anti-sigma B factor antagonist
METAIGVFAARERAEQAIQKLLEQGVPESSIIYLTRSETEAKSVAKQLGAYAGSFVGGAAGLSAGIAAATLLAVPGIGQVFALGFGAAALLGLAGAGTGAAVGATAAHDPNAPQPTSGIGATEDAAFFRRVLNEGRSLIVVRTDSHQHAAVASETLDQLGISMKKGAAPKCNIATRSADGAVIADVSGRIALGEGTLMLRDTVRGFLDKGQKGIILNLSAVEFVDSAGLGELVRTHASVRSHGGQLKLVNLHKNVKDLLRTTKLEHVFEIEPDEAAALSSLRQRSATTGA